LGKDTFGDGGTNNGAELLSLAMVGGPLGLFGLFEVLVTEDETSNGGGSDGLS